MKKLAMLFVISLFSLSAWALQNDIKTAIEGHTFEWRWSEGAFKGAAFNVTFKQDGELAWKGIEGLVVGKGDIEKEYVVKSISENVKLISWSEKSGYTVTIVLNFENGLCTGVVSKGQEWYPLSGRFSRVN